MIINVEKKLVEYIEALEQENKQLQEKINKAIGYANERINYCYHNKLDSEDWEELFDVLLGDEERK